MELAREISKARQVLITACGTSSHAALLGRYLLSKLGGKLCEVVTASEFNYLTHSVDDNTLVIAVSQSGETADVIRSVKRAKARGARVFSIINVVGSLLARISHRVIYTNCGPEIGVAATKSFASQIRDYFAENGAKLRELAQRIKDESNVFYIARGPNVAMAAEGALKLKELSYIHAEYIPAGELKHGTLALIDERTPVVAICPQDDNIHETMNNIMEIKARGGFR